MARRKLKSEVTEAALWVIFTVTKESLPVAMCYTSDMNAAFFFASLTPKDTGVHVLVFAVDTTGVPLVWFEPHTGEEGYLPEPGDWIESTPGLLLQLNRAAALFAAEQSPSPQSHSNGVFQA